MKLFKKINDLFGFGFGIIDNWIFVYAAGTTICGIGAGMFFVVLVYMRRSLKVNALTVTSVAFIVLGTVFANIAHSILKKKAIAAEREHQV